jgi:hypothetical protein
MYLFAESILHFKKTSMANEKLFFLEFRIGLQLKIFLIFHPGTQILNHLRDIIGFLESLAGLVEEQIFINLFEGEEDEVRFC